MQSIFQQISRVSAVAFVLTAMFSVCGCHNYVNPWIDETVDAGLITTASVEGYKATDTSESALRTRGFETTLVSPQDGTVSHFPLWWEDPFEDRGSHDGLFAVTWEDYFGMPYGFGRFIVNTIGVPVTAVVNPPVPQMGSDGITSEQRWAIDHDASWLPSGDTSTPPDILEIGSIPSETAQADG